MSIFLIRPTNPKCTAVERKCIECLRVFYISASDIKLGRGKYCSRICKFAHLRGENHVAWKPKPTRVCKHCRQKYQIENWRLKDERRGVFCSLKCQKKFYIGLNAPNWRGGITPINHSIRTSRSMEKWRNSVLKRDNYKCVWCGSSEKLEADHIKPFAKYPDLRLDLNNGRTLCRPCHIKTFKKVTA